jgi:hypothetical protein
MKGVIFTIHDRPGLKLTLSENVSLVKELRGLASLSLNPLPNYQCFSRSPRALDDKIIITAHKKIEKDNRVGGADVTEQGDLVAFTSAVLLPIQGLDEGGEVFHTGLTVVDPSIRRQGLLVQLFMRLLIHILTGRSPTDRIWITSLSEIPNSLVHVTTFMAEVFPSPSVACPSETHLLIARAIDRDHREKMLISPTATFEEGKFVFRGSNNSEEGRVFLKDANDPQYWHRNRLANDFYRALLKNTGDEVLQASNPQKVPCRGSLTE